MHVGRYRTVTGKVFDWKITHQLLATSNLQRQMVEGVLLMLAGAGIAGRALPIKTAIDSISPSPWPG